MFEQCERSVMAVSAILQPTTKRRRITKACDFCHRRGRKCRPSVISEDQFPVNSTAQRSRTNEPSAPCLTCAEHGVPCTWNRVSAKRGAKPRGEKSRSPQEQPGERSDGQSFGYQTERHGSKDLLHALLRVYFDTVFPVFPFFEEEVVFQYFNQIDDPESPAAFTVLTAIWALSTAHVHDGAVFTNIIEPSTITESRKETYIEDCISSIPPIIPQGDEFAFAYLQAVGTLSLAAIQIGNAALFHRLLGLYHGIIAQESFHNEARWPATISPTERNSRRRFFWSMYRLEVHSALVMGHMIRCPEIQQSIAYPDAPDPMSGDPSEEGQWLIGWNYITDLYRVLEYVILRFRARRIACVGRDSYWEESPLSIQVDRLFQTVLGKADNLPWYLKAAETPSTSIELNRCGFQVANIVCTTQLLRMILFTCQDVNFQDACRAALDLINGISQVPIEYLRAVGSPMLQELSGVGHVLSSYIGRPLSPTEYQELRKVIFSMASFLESLGNSLPSAVEAASKLSHHIGRIDEYLKRMRTRTTAHHRGLSLGSSLDESQIRAAMSMGHRRTISASVSPSDVIPLEYLQPIPWPGVFGFPEAHEEPNMLNIFQLGGN